MDDRRLNLAARWVFPVHTPPIPGGRVTIEQGRIVAVEPAAPGAADLDLGNAAILPGLVNAHTHLELGPLPGADPAVPENQVDWLRRVVACRRSAPPDQAASLVHAHVAELLATGTTQVADNTTAGLSWPILAASPLRGSVYSELIGLRRERALETSSAAWTWLARAQAEAHPRLRPGLGPHAPYSTVDWLYRQAAESEAPLSTHLAELPEELTLLADRSGPLRAFLEDIGAWDPDWRPLSAHPADHVRKGSLRHADWLIAHGTYLEPEDYWQLRPAAAPGTHRVAVVYCPRTHHRFGHRPHPFRTLIERGIVVCLGTDSRASTPSLSLLDEMRFLQEAQPDLDGRVILAMATLCGAWALRNERETGSLEPGKAADLALVNLPDHDDPDPHRLLLDARAAVRATLIAGRCVAGALA